MLTISENEKKILDGLLKKNPKKVAEELGTSPQKVYSTKHYFKKKVQNAEEFLAVARGKYHSLLRRRLSTPKIMPVDNEDEEFA